MTGCFKSLWGLPHKALCVCVSLPADGLAPAELLHACGCASDEPQRHVLQPRGLSEQPEPVGRRCLSEWRCHAVSTSGFPAQKRSVCWAPTEAPQHRQHRLVLFPQRSFISTSKSGAGSGISRDVFSVLLLCFENSIQMLFFYVSHWEICNNGRVMLFPSCYAQTSICFLLCFVFHTFSALAWVERKWDQLVVSWKWSPWRQQALIPSDL